MPEERYHVHGNGGDGQAGVHEVPLPAYETSDVSSKAMVRWAIGLAVFVVVSMALMLSYYALWRGPVGRRPAQVVERRLPPWPRLQANPVREYADYEAEQRRLMETYGWTDRQRGMVRIPVDQAIQRVVRDGLPTWASNEKRGGEQ